jgi:hypothetical protein
VSFKHGTKNPLPQRLPAVCHKLATEPQKWKEAGCDWQDIAHMEETGNMNKILATTSRKGILDVSWKII